MYVTLRISVTDRDAGIALCEALALAVRATLGEDDTDEAEEYSLHVLDESGGSIY